MDRLGSGLRRIVAVALVAVAGAAIAPAAQDTTVSFGPDASGVFRLTIGDAQGVNDNVLVQCGETAVFVADRASPPTLTEATGCRRERTTIFRCAEGVVESVLLLLQVEAFLGGGDDRYESVTNNFRRRGRGGSDDRSARAGRRRAREADARAGQPLVR